MGLDFVVKEVGSGKCRWGCSRRWAFERRMGNMGCDGVRVVFIWIGIMNRIEDGLPRDCLLGNKNWTTRDLSGRSKEIFCLLFASYVVIL
jgi:hypothetical protein